MRCCHVLCRAKCRLSLHRPAGWHVTHEPPLPPNKHTQTDTRMHTGHVALPPRARPTRLACMQPATPASPPVFPAAAPTSEQNAPVSASGARDVVPPTTAALHARHPPHPTARAPPRRRIDGARAPPTRPGRCHRDPSEYSPPPLLAPTPIIPHETPFSSVSSSPSPSPSHHARGWRWP